MNIFDRHFLLIAVSVLCIANGAVAAIPAGSFQAGPGPAKAADAPVPRSPLESPEPELATMTLEDLLEVPIIAASAIAERPSDSPTTACVISAATIRDRGYATLLDLLEDLPEIQVNRGVETGHHNTVTVQGVHGNERLQVMIDGVRVTPLTGNLTALGRQISLRNARQVEVILGPMSALYGPDVFSGVINIVTRTGAEMPSHRLDLGIGEDATRDLALSVGGRFDPDGRARARWRRDASFAVTAHRFRSDGVDWPQEASEEFAWYNQQFRDGRLLLAPGSTAETTAPFRPYDAREEADFLHARLELRRFELGVIRMSELHSSSTSVRPEYTIYDADAVFKTRYHTVFGRHTAHGPRGRWTLQSVLSHHFYQLDPRSRFTNNFSGYQPAYKYAEDSSTALEERYTRDLGRNRHLVLGLNWQSHDSLPRTEDLPYPFDTKRAAADQGFVYPGSTLDVANPGGIPQQFFPTGFHNFGTYAQMQVRPNPTLHWIFGARYDENTRYGSSLNPRFGVVLRPRDRVNLKFMVGTAFLAPPPDRTWAHFGAFVADPDRPGDIRSWFFHVPNPDLRPERVRSAQSEFSYRFSDKIRATLSLYDSHIQDIQMVMPIGSGTFMDKPVATLAHWTNRGTSRSYGGSLRFDGLHQCGRFRLNSFVALSCANGDLAGDPLPYLARTTVKAGLTLRHGRWTWSPRLVSQGRSLTQDRDAAGNLRDSPGFTVADLHVQYRCSERAGNGRGITAFLHVENLANHRYHHPGFADGAVGFAAVPQPPRRLSGGLTVEF